VTTQKGFGHLEIVVIDSGSVDGTAETARRFGASVMEIPPATFNHGLTRNLGIRHSRGEICVLLVQDALPVADDWLQALTSHFESNPLICGVTTRQVPRPGTDIVTQWEVTQHNDYLGTEAKIRSIPDWHAFERLSMQERFFVCNFDNVCSAVRRSTWEIHPFRALPFAEDLDWGVRVLRAGNSIVYEPAASVVHSHIRPAIYHLRRHYVSAKVVPKILECPIRNPAATNETELFSETNALLEEACSFLLLVSQLDRRVSRVEWLQWVKYCQSAGLKPSAEARHARHIARAYARRIWRRLPLPRSIKSRLLTAIRHQPMRAHFLFLLSRVTRSVPELSQSELCQIIVHCLARTTGAFLGSYYLWSEQQDQVSPELRTLDRSLCIGV
jgi:glycosyltransferase involved in cell wall biosynthesis